MSADTLLSKLDSVQGRNGRWRAICPAHQSSNKSRTLAIKEDGGTVLLHCFAGCSVHDVLGAVGMDVADLFPPTNEHRKPEKRPFSTREVAQALRAETMVAFVLLADIAAGKTLTRSDRERAAVAAERAAILINELAA